MFAGSGRRVQQAPSDAHLVVMDEWVGILGHGGQGSTQGLNCCCLETVLIVTITITLNTHFAADVSTRRHYACPHPLVLQFWAKYLILIRFSRSEQSPNACVIV